jgi:hypothetical protein
MLGGVEASSVRRHSRDTYHRTPCGGKVLLAAWLLGVYSACSEDRSESIGFFPVAAHSIGGKLSDNHDPQLAGTEGRHDIFSRNGNRGSHFFHPDRNDTESSEPGMDEGICGAESPADVAVRENTRRRRQWWKKRNHGRGERDLQAAIPTVNVNVNFVVIQTTAGAGYLSSAQIQRQINAMNQFYWPQFQFRLLNTPTSMIYYHTSDAHYNCTESLANDFKPLLRKGGADTLNVYICKSPTSLGWATYPWSGASGGRDGIVIHEGTLPGMYLKSYNEGKVSPRPRCLLCVFGVLFVEGIPYIA